MGGRSGVRQDEAAWHLETFPDADQERSVCDKPTQFDGVGAHGRSISIDLDWPDQPATIFRNPACLPPKPSNGVWRAFWLLP
jgi:hypothetical protein